MDTNDAPLFVSDRSVPRAASLPSVAYAMGSLDDLPVSVLVFETSALIDANDEWAAISGLDVSESAGDRWLQVVHPDDRRQLHELVNDSASDTPNSVNVRVGAQGRPADWFRAHVRTLCATVVKRRC